MGGVTFLIFGAVLLGPALKHVSWQIALYAVLSLTLVRMLPVAIAMIRTGARRPTVGFLGWFGPRGLASIVFAVIVVEEAHLPGADTILLTTYLTIGLSVLAHGITAAPLAKRYARWYESHPRDTPAGDGERPRPGPPHARGAPPRHPARRHEPSARRSPSGATCLSPQSAGHASSHASCAANAACEPEPSSCWAPQLPSGSPSSRRRCTSGSTSPPRVRSRCSSLSARAR